MNFEEFKKLTNFLSYNNLLKAYLVSLKLYDNTIFVYNSNNTEKLQCIFSLGDSSLTSYRILKLSNKLYFEKIYLTNSEDLNKMEYYYSNYFNKIYSSVELHEIHKGKKLTVVLYEYQSSNNINLVSPLNVSVEFTLKSFLVTNTSFFKNIFEKERLYYESFLILINKYTNYKDKLFEIESILTKKLPLIYTHGDIFHKNIIENKLIDFDRAGYYPFGYDIGRTLSSELDNLDFKKIDDAINSVVARINQQLPSKLIELSIYYFTLIFVSRKQILFPKEFGYTKDYVEKLYNKLVFLYSKL
ncbi:MAG: hypothetical protein LAT51_09115 [Flavobacteriaceae bacterium]|nr:hypothetical protein [Flavobacteriaceae bacterium]